jgi:hypothetical protein
MDSTLCSSEAELYLSADRPAGSNKPPASSYEISYNYFEKQSHKNVTMTRAAATTMIETTGWQQMAVTTTIIMKYRSLSYDFLCTFSQ